MSTATAKSRKPPVRKKTGLSLPLSTSTIEIEGKRYLLTPETDMAEWLEDVEDILDSRVAMDEPGESIPLEKIVSDLKLKLPPRRK